VNTLGTPAASSTRPTRTRGARRLALLVAVVVLLLGGHAFLLYKVSVHAAVSAVALTILLTLVTIKHLGLVGSLYGLYRRRLRQNETP
jgi:hypothetical protein